jgi:hypothetical protein
LATDLVFERVGDSVVADALRTLLQSLGDTSLT